MLTLVFLSNMSQLRGRWSANNRIFTNQPCPEEMLSGKGEAIVIYRLVILLEFLHLVLQQVLSVGSISS